MANTFSLHDTHLGICFEGVGEFTNARCLYDDMIRFLRKAGWKIGPNPHTKKHYPSLNEKQRLGRFGDLYLSLECSGRMVTAEFYQEIVKENPHGGRYDFYKLKKMPYLIRKRFELTVAKLWKFLLAWGENLVPRRQRIESPVPDPLAWFNSHWNMGYEEANAINRFKRGPDGWPSDDELKCWKRIDADGQQVRHGDLKYVRVNGRYYPARVYGGINGMWTCIYGREWTQRGVYDIHSTTKGRGRFFSDEEKKRSIQRTMLKALKEWDFARADRIALYCARAGISLGEMKVTIGAA